MLKQALYNVTESDTNERLNIASKAYTKKRTKKSHNYKQRIKQKLDANNTPILNQKFEAQSRSKLRRIL